MCRAKVVLVGAAHTGKTSIVNRFIYGEFSPHTMPSTQPAFFQKKIWFDGTEFTLDIWDTAGQEQYHALSPMFYRDADAGIVVFDLTDSASFNKSKQWVSELRQARGTDISLVVAGNKSDLISQRAISLEAVNTFSASIAASSFDTSAKTGENIDLLFNALVKQLAKALSQTETGQTIPRDTKRRKGVKFDEAPPRDSGCC